MPPTVLCSHLPLCSSAALAVTAVAPRLLDATSPRPLRRSDRGGLARVASTCTLENAMPSTEYRVPSAADHQHARATVHNFSRTHIRGPPFFTPFFVDVKIATLTAIPRSPVWFPQLRSFKINIAPVYDVKLAKASINFHEDP